MTTAIGCANCHHKDHHIIDKMGHRTMPCFHLDPTQADGFCPCQAFKEAENAEEFANAILGPVTEAKEPSCVCRDPMGQHPDLGQCLNFSDCHCEEFEWDGKGPRPLLLEEAK